MAGRIYTEGGARMSPHTAPTTALAEAISRDAHQHERDQRSHGDTALRRSAAPHLPPGGSALRQPGPGSWRWLAATCSAQTGTLAWLGGRSRPGESLRERQESAGLGGRATRSHAPWGKGFQEADLGPLVPLHPLSRDPLPLAGTHPKASRVVQLGPAEAEKAETPRGSGRTYSFLYNEDWSLGKRRKTKYETVRSSRTLWRDNLPHSFGY